MKHDDTRSSPEHGFWISIRGKVAELSAGTKVAPSQVSGLIENLCKSGSRLRASRRESGIMGMTRFSSTLTRISLLPYLPLSGRSKHILIKATDWNVQPDMVKPGAFEGFSNVVAFFPSRFHLFPLPVLAAYPAWFRLLRNLFKPHSSIKPLTELFCRR